jgi:hypothetical protein
VHPGAPANAADGPIAGGRSKTRQLRCNGNAGLLRFSLAANSAAFHDATRAPEEFRDVFNERSAGVRTVFRKPGT